jgi:hypothetical protein
VVTVTATVDGKSGTASITVQTSSLTVRVTNSLLAPVNVRANAVLLGTVEPGATVNFPATRSNSVVVEWDLVRPRTAGGVEIGEALSETFAAVANPPDWIEYWIDNEIGGVSYFAPVMTNMSSANWLMGVNMGTAWEVRCNCVVNASGTDFFLGYYRLSGTGNVRAYREGSNYTGTYKSWAVYPFNLAAYSGKVVIWSSVAPNSTGTQEVGGR